MDENENDIESKVNCKDDESFKNESSSRLADLNEHHFFSAKELSNMSEYDKAKTSKNDNLNFENFADHL